MKKHNRLSLPICFVMALTLFCGCGAKEKETEAEGEHNMISVVFAQYPVAGASSVKTVYKDDRVATECRGIAEGESAALSCTEYKPENIDLGKYCWAAVEYLYSSEAPTAANMKLCVPKETNGLTGECESNSESQLQCDKWATALFDISAAASLLEPEAEEHILSSFCLMPYGETKAEKANLNDIIYISRIMFFTYKPDEKALSEQLNSYDYTQGDAKHAEIDLLEANRITEIRQTDSEYDESANTIYYVSNRGVNTNAGTSPSAPLKTIARALRKAQSGDVVLLERGGEWRERATVAAGITISAYGAGSKPIINASPEDGAADAASWSLYYEDGEVKLWKYGKDLPDVGNIIFNSGKAYGIKDIPTLYNGQRTFRGTTERYDIAAGLDQNYKFVSMTEQDPSVKCGLYLRCDEGNPADVWDSIEFAAYGNAITVAQDGVTIDNICVQYSGCHGIGSGSRKDLTVQNCEIRWIGGSVQYYSADSGDVVRFGNGVEVYGSCDNFKILGCYVWQCYDAGITFQLSSGFNNDCHMDNILFKDNLITDCVYDIEYFMGSPASNDVAATGSGIVIDGNILRRAGFGFGSTRPDGYAQRCIQSWAHYNSFSDFTISNNLLDSSVWDLFYVSSAVEGALPSFDGNTYIQGSGNKLFTYGINGDGAYEADTEARESICGVVGDKTGRVYTTDYIPYYVYPYSKQK